MPRKPDGLTIGMFNTGLIYDQLLKRDGVLFDLNKFSWIGKAADDTRVLMLSNKLRLQEHRRRSEVQSADQIRCRGRRIGRL